jgi:hypothetical protein
MDDEEVSSEYAKMKSEGDQELQQKMKKDGAVVRSYRLVCRHQNFTRTLQSTPSLIRLHR